MPKKGKGKGKKKGKGDKKATGPPPPVVQEDEAINEDTRVFYLIQIKDLEGRLSRYQGKCDQLQLQNDELQKQLSQQLEDQEQMITFLKKKGQDQTEAYIDLEEKLAAILKAKETETEQYEQQISQLKEDSQRALDQAAVENKVLQGQLEALENFRLNKDKLEGEMKDKEALLEQMKEEHSQALYKLEKKAVLDKDRMKKEMVAKVNSVAAEFRKVSDLQMAETTKRTIRENVAISTQLNKMSDRTMEIIRENEQMKVKEKELKQEVEILEAQVKELSKANISNQRVMAMLRDRAGEHQDIAAEFHQRAMQCNVLDIQAKEAGDLAMASGQEAELLRKRVLTLEEELRVVRSQLEETTKELHKLRNIIGKASSTIQLSLQPKSSDGEQVAQRENLLATLLQVMNFSPVASRQGSSRRSPTSIHYKPGDLGFVPAHKKMTSNEPLKAGVRAPLPPITSSGPSVASTATHKQTQFV